MNLNQMKIPLFQTIKKFIESKPLSFHVPGHKNGEVFTTEGLEYYKGILSMDVTELTGLDDLHSAQGSIAAAQNLAASWFKAKHTFFLVGGSTVGNLAMILATCSTGDKVVVQRNCHKSILNGLELSGAHPIFVTPEFDSRTDRFGDVEVDSIRKALVAHPTTKAVILTYPDYFGRTYALKEIINVSHEHGVPVLVDEAHGVHFSLGHIFPASALQLGADIVVQSAHKMAPAMTMGAYLHFNSEIVRKEKVEHYLQVLQSSSPSYPIMASLDLARYFLENMSIAELEAVKDNALMLRQCFEYSENWQVLPFKEGVDDPLKITIQVKEGFTGQQIASLFEDEHIYPELSTHNQVLFILGLKTIYKKEQVLIAIEKVNERLKLSTKNATIDSKISLFTTSFQALTYSYEEMKQKEVAFISWENAVGLVAAEAVIPYPPGIPLIARGETVTEQHIKMVKYLYQQRISFQNKDIKYGLKVFQ